MDTSSWGNWTALTTFEWPPKSSVSEETARIPEPERMGRLAGSTPPPPPPPPHPSWARKLETRDEIVATGWWATLDGGGADHPRCGYTREHEGCLEETGGAETRHSKASWGRMWWPFAGTVLTTTTVSILYFSVSSLSALAAQTFM